MSKIVGGSIFVVKVTLVFDVEREESTTKKLKNKARNQAESIVRKLIEPVAGDKRELIVKWIVRKKAVVNGGFA